MKRYLIHLLLLCTLVSSQAWAWDNHDGLIGEDPVAAPMLLTPDGGPGVDTSAPCDHYCCHGFAHLAGLSPASISIDSPQPGALRSTCQNRPVSHVREPLIRPPQA